MVLFVLAFVENIHLYSRAAGRELFDSHKMNTRFTPTVRSEVEERVAEERPAWNDKNIPAWPKNISVL